MVRLTGPGEAICSGWGWPVEISDWEKLIERHNSPEQLHHPSPAAVTVKAHSFSLVNFTAQQPQFSIISNPTFSSPATKSAGRIFGNPQGPAPLHPVLRDDKEIEEQSPLTALVLAASLAQETTPAEADYRLHAYFRGPPSWTSRIVAAGKSYCH